jgi:hypothetical protein
MITGGTITGGTISGGVITGATITGVTITGGMVTGGMISGGTNSGGTNPGGAITGVTITGVTITGATITTGMNPGTGGGIGGTGTPGSGMGGNGGSQSGAGGGMGGIGGNGGSNNIVVNPNPGAAVGTDANSIPVKYLCSNKRTRNNNGNVKSSTKPLTVVFSDEETGKEYCRMTDAKLKATILNEKRLLIPETCPKPAAYSKITVTLYETQDQDFLYSGFRKNTVEFHGSNHEWKNGEMKSLYVLVDINDESDLLNDEDDPCDERASPLFVDLGNNETLSLLPPTKGIEFNILGRNSFPSANTKKQISWFSNDQFMFLVNPTNSGMVHGVDQMFGDNTYGPDRRFSDDGFMALGKHDSNYDGVIDREDPVFQKLRLWSDSNGDGIAEPGELFYLDYMNVTSIDLEYDPSYYEKDIYGNEIRYKSVIQLKDGSVKLMFDLWFRYL